MNRARRFLAFLLATVVCAACASGSPRPASKSSPAASPAAASPAPLPSPSAAAPAWTTYHADGARDGYDPSTHVDASVGRRWASRALDGPVYGEPLVFANLVIVATENDSVYALRPADGSIAWRVHLGTPVSGGALPCGDIDPIGVTSTPVIDGATGTVFVVASVQPLHHELVAIDAAGGAVRWHRTVDPPGSQPLYQQQRGALGLGSGRIYVPFGGRDGDCGPYHGYLVAAPESGSGSLETFTVAAPRQGGLWAASGPAIDAGGDVLVTSGNSSNGSSPNFDAGTPTGNAVFKLSPSLQKLDSFTPSNWAQLNAGDVDLGSTGPLLLPGALVFQVGKTGTGYLLDEGRLGGIGGQVFAGQVCGAAFGGEAAAAGYVYVPCTNGLVALRVDPNARTFAVAWRGPAVFASPPIVTADVVWSVDRSDSTLVAFRAADGSVLYRDHLAAEVPFETPTAAGGQVYVAAGSTIVAYAG